MKLSKTEKKYWAEMCKRHQELDALSVRERERRVFDVGLAYRQAAFWQKEIEVAEQIFKNLKLNVILMRLNYNLGESLERLATYGLENECNNSVRANTFVNATKHYQKALTYTEDSVWQTHIGCRLGEAYSGAGHYKKEAGLKEEAELLFARGRECWQTALGGIEFRIIKKPTSE